MVALGLYLLLHLLMQSLIYKFVKKWFINGGLDAALQDALYGGLNVALEGGTIEFTLKAFENVQEHDEKDTLNV